MSHTPTEASSGRYLDIGTPAYRRASLALFAAGFATFATLYCVQPLLPAFTEEFGVSPAQSSLTLSLATAVLAPAMVVASAISENVGRKPVMVVSLLMSALLALLCAVVPGWPGLLAIRALEGIALAGLPAVAMAYVGEEMDPKAAARVMGLYVGGTALGGMSGRVLTGLLADVGSWRLAIGAVGLLGLAACAAVAAGLPPSRHFARRPLGLGHFGAALRQHLADAGLPWLFLMGFLLMGGFVTVYNYLGFRLMAEPYGLGASEVGGIFLIYLVGVAGSTWFGGLAGRFGRRRVLWIAVALTLAGLGMLAASPLWAIIAGLAVLTFGFFGAHAVVSGWIAHRARTAKAQASSFYLFSYYLGSSLVGYFGGFFWSGFGWPGVAALVGLLFALGLAVSLRLAWLRPLPAPAGPSA